MASALKEFRVIQAAIVIRVGKAKNDVRRFVRGEILRLPATSTRTKDLLAAKAIAPNEAGQPTTVTPAQVMQAVGAEADPVAANIPVTGEGVPAPDADADEDDGSTPPAE